MKILVTGATGFLGRRLYDKLKEGDNNVVGISKKGNRRIGVFKVDIANKAEVTKLFINNRFDRIFHLAAYIPKADSGGRAEEIFNCFNVNVLGTINLVEEGLKHGLKNLVFASSASVYPENPEIIPVSERRTNPRNFYGESKLLAEIYLEKYSKFNKISCLCLRYSSVFGPGQTKNSVLPLFFRRARRGNILPVFGSGKRSQDFVYIDDVVNITIKAGLENRYGIYNIGSGCETNMLNLAKTVVSVVGGGKVKIFPELGQESRFYLDIGKAKMNLGYSPEYQLIKGLEEMVKIDNG